MLKKVKLVCFCLKKGTYSSKLFLKHEGILKINKIKLIDKKCNLFSRK